MTELTTLKIGGPAKKLVKVQTEDELIAATKFAEEIKLPFLVIGGGSNLLVADQGVNRLIIKNELTGISHQGSLVTVKSGTVLQDLIDYCNDRSLSGLQNLAGIPGTVGGAIYGNAGAYGQGISDNLISVRVFNGSEIVELQKQDCQFSYRDSEFKRNRFSILGATFKLEPGNSIELKQQSQDIIQKRLVKYPKGIKCPGSFFKNIVASDLPKEVLEKIPEDKIVYGKLPAGSLLEMVGAKGDKQGDIEIADYHANLFVNLGSGNAKDFYALAKKYVEKVREKFRINLEPEVQLINLPPLTEV